MLQLSLAAAKDNFITSPLKQLFYLNPITLLKKKSIYINNVKHPKYNLFSNKDTAINNKEYKYTAFILASNKV